MQNSIPLKKHLYSSRQLYAYSDISTKRVLMILNIFYRRFQVKRDANARFIRAKGNGAMK